MKVLFAASECAPFVKTGGLADVIGAVPKALSALGVDVRVMLPGYPEMAAIMKGGKTVRKIKNLHGGSARLVAKKAEGLNLLLLDAPHLFDRAGNIYLGPDGKDWKDNHLRFGGFSQIAAEVARDGIKGWQPDIVHAHDWQASLIPAYLKTKPNSAPPCVLTIHNIAFQGLCEPSALPKLGLPKKLFAPDGLEYWGKVNFLKAGIVYSDRITTVSPTYANELSLPEFGMGMDGILQTRRDVLSGILNGIDLDVWNPETDPDLAANYSARTLSKKKKNRAAVEKRFGLKHNPDAPLFCVVSRLTEQKGLDLLLDVLPGLVDRGARLALLGSGDKSLEAGFIAATRGYTGSVGAVIGYDESLSHLLQGGSDAILIPSRFEPCGLTQLYGLRYGTIPLVSRTGGLADTVIDANEAALADNCATGVQFSPIHAAGLYHAIARTCDLYAQPKVWAGMQRRAMRQQIGWDRSAQTYLDLYKSLGT